MLNFEEELKKFQPSLEVDFAEVTQSRRTDHGYWLSEVRHCTRNSTDI